MMADDASGLIGKKFVAERPVEVTEAMIIGFSAAIGETNPLHADPDFARNGPYGRIVAPLSISGSFRAVEDIFDLLPRNERRLLGSMELEFVTPISAGDKIHIASEIADIYEKTGRSGALTFTVIRSTLTNQDGAIVTRIVQRFTSRKGRPTNE
jgi:acyl dehydratase